MKTIKNNLYLLKMIYADDKKRIFYMIFLSFIAALKNIIAVLFIKIVLDCIISYQSFLYLALLVLVERAISYMLSYLECYIQWKKCPVSDSIIRERLLKRVYASSLKVELSKLDNSEFYDKFNRAVGEAEQRPFAIISTLENVLTSVLTIVAVSAVIVLLDWKLILLSIASAVIGILLNFVISKYNYKADLALTRPGRKIGYIQRLFYLPQYIEEMKTNNYNELFFSKLESGAKEHIVQIKKYKPPIAFFDIIKNWQVLAINFGLASVFIGERIVSGLIEAASFTSLVYASVTLSGSLSNFFSVIPQLAEHSLFIDNLREILDYKSSMEPTEDTKEVKKSNGHSIALENVTFQYNFGSTEVLKDITLRINKGEKIALVGENGAGKSTLVKLILRLYDPQSGNVYFDGENYKDLNVDSLRNEIAVVYQDFQSFAFSIGENVLTRELSGEADERKVYDALKASGLYSKVESLPDKIDTPLTNEFDENGTNLSGGENQKLAIAKAICKNAGVVIMDEPSSSLDPLSEHEMYLNMFNMCRDKTLILISHRLYSTKMVDKIYYIENGTVAECGNHDELIKLNGRYAHLYNTQAEQYK